MSGPVEDSLRALSRYFVGAATMNDTLTMVCTSAMDAVKAAVMVGLSMTVDGKPGTYVFTHPAVPEMDERQYETGDGPCLDAFHLGHVIYVPSTDAPGPYPDFRAAAVENGIQSVVSVPLNTDTVTVGALNFYSERDDAFTETDRALAQEFATQAAYLLLNAQAYWDARTLSENLSQAMASRAVIEQAKGIIMASTGVDADEAFDQLREQSQHENVKLREIAAEIVSRAQRRHRAQ